MIRRNTPEREAENRRYNEAVKIWLRQPENRHCVVALILGWGIRSATQCHHQRGRIGDLLLDQRFWLPVSAAGHQWIGMYPRQSKGLGLIAVPWNHQPGPEEPALVASEVVALAREAIRADDSLRVPASKIFASIFRG